MVTLEPVDLTDVGAARRLQGIFRLAYTQEARLLGLKVFPPADLTTQQIQSSGHFCLGAFCAGNLVGAVCVGLDDEPDQIQIAYLVVSPQHQRQGIGRLLTEAVLQRGEGMTFSVSTAKGNGPALALYAQLGFGAYRSGTVGPNELPLVKLRRVRSNPSLNRSANGGPPSPVCGEVHSPQPGPGVLPSSPA